MRRFLVVTLAFLAGMSSFADKRVAKLEYELFVNGLPKGREKIRVDVDKKDDIELTSSDLFYKLPYPAAKRQYVELYIYPEFRRQLGSGDFDSYIYRMKINDFSDMDLVETDQSAREMIDQQRTTADFTEQIAQSTDNVMRDHIDFGVNAGGVEKYEKTLHFKATKVMVDRAKDEPIKGPVAVLDPMTATVYPFLLSQLKGEGPTWEFWFAIPQYLKYRPGTVESHGVVEMSVRGQSCFLQHYDVRVDGGIFSSFWVDRAGQIIQIAMPRDGFVSILKDAPIQSFEKAVPVVRQESFAMRAALSETPVSLASGGVTLGATFIAPEGKGPHPTVLLLQDFGPTDRDGNLPGGAGISGYRQLAYLLAERGFASLRADARGIGQSGGDREKTSLGQREADIESQAAWLRANPAVRQDRLFVLANGLSGWLALKTEGVVKPAGFVLVAYPAKPFARLLREQALSQINPAASGKAARELNDLETALAAGEEWGSFQGSRRYLPALRDLMKLDPLALVQASAAPALFAYPEKDEIVFPFHLEIVKSVAKAEAQQTSLLPHTEHSLLKDDPQSGVSGVLDRDAVQTLADWLARRCGAP